MGGGKVSAMYGQCCEGSGLGGLDGPTCRNAKWKVFEAGETVGPVHGCD